MVLIRCVRMVVRQGRVPVRMRVWLGTIVDRMRVLMVLIVHVQMFVIERVVGVQMSVALTNEERDGEGHGCTRNEGRHRQGLAENRKGRECANEGGRGEERGLPCGAVEAKRVHVQQHAEPVTHSAEQTGLEHDAEPGRGSPNISANASVHTPAPIFSPGRR